MGAADGRRGGSRRAGRTWMKRRSGKTQRQRTPSSGSFMGGPIANPAFSYFVLLHSFLELVRLPRVCRWLLLRKQEAPEWEAHNEPGFSLPAFFSLFARTRQHAGETDREFGQRAPARPRSGSGPQIAEAEGDGVEQADAHRIVVLRRPDQHPLAVAELERLERVVGRVDELQVAHPCLSPPTPWRTRPAIERGCATRAFRTRRVQVWCRASSRFGLRRPRVCSPISDKPAVPVQNGPSSHRTRHSHAVDIVGKRGRPIG